MYRYREKFIRLSIYERVGSVRRSTLFLTFRKERKLCDRRKGGVYMYLHFIFTSWRGLKLNSRKYATCRVLIA